MFLTGRHYVFLTSKTKYLVLKLMSGLRKEDKIPNDIFDDKLKMLIPGNV